VNVWTRAWHGWKKFAHKVGDFQARVLLTIFYSVVVLPFGLATRFCADPLRIRTLPTHWLEHPDEASDLGWAKRQ
jgi:hypothetical protein